MLPLSTAIQEDYHLTAQRYPSTPADLPPYTPLYRVLVVVVVATVDGYPRTYEMDEL